MSDITNIKVSSEGITHLKLALDIVLSSPEGSSQYCDWHMTYDDTLYFGWGSKKNILPSRLNTDSLLTIITSWLENTSYGYAPDIDGECHKGWELLAGSKHISYDTPESFYITFGIRPKWIEYHK